MALWFDIKVNRDTVGTVCLTRIYPTDGQPADGDHCIYNIDYEINRPGNKKTLHAVVYHPYVPDNPIPLLAKTLEQIKDFQ